MPEDKVKAMEELGQRYGQVAMVCRRQRPGDGACDRGCCGGRRDRRARETADVSLMADGLSRLLFAVGLSRASGALFARICMCRWAS